MDAEHLSCGPSELRSAVSSAHQISKASCAKKSGSCVTDHFHIDYISKYMHQIMYRECFGEIGLNKILKLTPPLVLVLVLVAQSCPTLATPWKAARQAPLSMGFSRQERRSGLPFPPPGDLPTPENRTRVSCLLHRGWIVYH